MARDRMDLAGGTNGRTSGGRASAAKRAAGEGSAAHDELESLSLEAALAQLDEIVAALEDGQLTLDDSLTLYERGMRLTKRCQEMLDTAELRVQRLRPVGATDDGFGGRESFALDPFEVDED